MPFSIQMRQGPVNQNICVLNLALGASSYFGGLDLFGVGCRILVNPLATFAMGPTNAAGDSQKLTVPAAGLAGLKGTTFLFQFWSVEPGVNALNLVVSDGVVALAK